MCVFVRVKRRGVAVTRDKAECRLPGKCVNLREEQTTMGEASLTVIQAIEKWQGKSNIFHIISV